jgi:ATP-dependent DNA helicase RecQ
MKQPPADIVIANRPASTTTDAMQALMQGMRKLPGVLNGLGFEGLREGQDRAVKSIMAQRDTVVILPTATGKSACFVVPTLCMGWRTIVIYPLIALMRDQATSMQRKGLAAASISSQETEAHNASVLRDWASGELQFMLVSPERFSNEEWANVVTQFPPDFVAMDEAHTFHEWADTFRPGYKFAGEFIQKVQPKVVAAFSATLSEEAEAEVRSGLGIVGAKLIYHYPRRQNLHLSSLFLDRMSEAPPWVVNNCDGPTIIYASTRKRVEEYAATLCRYTSRNVFFYHGGMQQKERRFNQDKFMADPDGLIVATNAFGMGVDKSDIRNVVHFDVPGTLVALAQEVGRAGRDGNDSFCTIIPTPEGIRTRKHFIRCGNPTPDDIKAFFRAAAKMREGAGGAIMATRDEICRHASIDPFASQAIMSFCLGERIFTHDTEAARQHRIRFEEIIPSLTTKEAETRNAIYDVGIDVKGWWQFDVEALAEQCDVEVTAVMARLRKMHDKGALEWVRSTSRKPLQIGLRPEEIPAESFERLKEKSARANHDLDLVLAYTEAADDEKHSFLEQHLNR